MTFSYSGDPTDSELDSVRFLTGDTDARLPLLSDEEIEWLITIWGDRNVYYHAAKAAESISAKMSREVSLTADSQSLTLSELQEKYSRLAVSLFHQYQDLLASGVELHAGGMTAGEHRDVTIAPLAFGTGMHDLPAAGQQDYGDNTQTGTIAQWGEYTP